MNFRRRERKDDSSISAHSKEPSGYAPSEKTAKNRPRPPLRFNPRLISVIGLYWLIIVHYIERVRVKNAMDRCQWDSWESWKGEKAEIIPHRVALVADPQLVDEHTYPKLPTLAYRLIRKMSDNYLYINFKYMQAYLDPDTTVFVGDLFDGGREWDDDAWLDEYDRFNRIFPEKPNRRSIRGLPGNHDIGFQNVSTYNQNRFAAFFGEPNDYYVLGNHTFVQLDTISFSHEDPKVHTEARAFFEQSKAKIDPSLPRIVLTHVPLYRDPRVETCGPGRESQRPFPLQRGHQYQTVIDYPYTREILHGLKPSLVISGDDHDYCDIVHVDYDDNSKKLAREISCKTNSMTNGIKYPAFHLLSLNHPIDPADSTNILGEPTYQTVMCYLPHPYLGVKIYLVSFLLCCCVFYLWAYHPSKLESYLEDDREKNLLPSSLKSTSSHSSKNHNDNRQTIFWSHCVLLFVSILLLLALYNRR